MEGAIGGGFEGGRIGGLSPIGGGGRNRSPIGGGGGGLFLPIHGGGG